MMMGFQVSSLLRLNQKVRISTIIIPRTPKIKNTKKPKVRKRAQSKNRPKIQAIQINSKTQLQKSPYLLQNIQICMRKLMTPMDIMKVC